MSQMDSDDLNPDPPPPDTAEDALTEDDLFRMKSLTQGMASIGECASETADQSIISLADSASNFDDHVGDEYDEVEAVEATISDEQVDGEYEDSSIDSQVSQNRIFGGWMFDRKRNVNPNLNDNTVTVFGFPKNVTIPPCPPGENEEEWKKAFMDARVYLVGTAHFSKESQDDVAETISETQPDMVMVELCPSRISILSMDEDTLLREAGDLNTTKIIQTVKQSGLIQGVLHSLLLSMSAHITRELKMAPGGEFRAAHRAVSQINLCRLVLGDRPIQITLQRALGSLNIWQKMKFFWHVAMSHNTSITPGEVERCKQKDLLEQLLAEMAGDFPQLSKIFVEERDAYMTHALHALLLKNTFEKRTTWMRTDATWQPIRIVAVVGIGHSLGITNYWNDPVDITPLVIIPEPSVTSKIVTMTWRIALWGTIGYFLYKGATRVSRHMAAIR